MTRDYLSHFDEILTEMIRGVTGAELTDSISRKFIVQMISHYKGVICMPEDALRFLICPERPYFAGHYLCPGKRGCGR